MGKIIVEIVSKPKILDPQGKTIKGSLARLGVASLEYVRQGERLELTTVEDVAEAGLKTAREAAGTLSFNPIIEDVISVRKDA